MEIPTRNIHMSMVKIFAIGYKGRGFESPHVHFYTIPSKSFRRSWKNLMKTLKKNSYTLQYIITLYCTSVIWDLQYSLQICLLRLSIICHSLPIFLFELHFCLEEGQFFCWDCIFALSFSIPFWFTWYYATSNKKLSDFWTTVVSRHNVQKCSLWGG